jgi:hypothetical protein
MVAFDASATKITYVVVNFDDVLHEYVLCRRRHNTCYAEHEIMPSRATHLIARLEEVL